LELVAPTERYRGRGHIPFLKLSISTWAPLAAEVRGRMALRRQGLLDGPNDERMRQRTGIQARLTGIFHIFFCITVRVALDG